MIFFSASAAPLLEVSLRKSRRRRGRKIALFNTGAMMRYEEVELVRDCEAVEIPQGAVVTLEAETPVVITQAFGMD